MVDSEIKEILEDDELTPFVKDLLVLAAWFRSILGEDAPIEECEGWGCV
jgi:hypothetical protein